MPLPNSQTFLRELDKSRAKCRRPALWQTHNESGTTQFFPRSQTADSPNGRINPPFNIKEWWDGKLEGYARRALIEKELVECMIALPSQLFINTQITLRA